MTRKTHILAALLLTAATASACASDPAPRALTEASDKLKAPDTARLAETRPRLIQEARALRKEARQAWKRGDLDEADLKARMALQKLSTAAHFAARDEALGRVGAMAVSVDEIEEEYARIERESQALGRYQQADAEFRRLEAELAQMKADDQSAQAKAQRAVVSARKRQGEAIGAGAPTAAGPVYEEGRLLLDTAISALREGLFEESMLSSEQASAKFDAAIAASKDSAVAQRRRAQQEEARQDESQKAADAARAAIDDAQTAQASAIAQRMPEKDKSNYEKATYLLELAGRSLEEERYDDATSRAKEALTIFKGAEFGADSPRGKAEAAIKSAQEARAGLVGMGITDLNLTREADYNLELAQGALKDGDFERATKLADDARADYEGALAFAPRLGVSGNARRAAAPAAGRPAPAYGNAPVAAAAGAWLTRADLARWEVEQLLLKVQTERAEALGASRDAQCPATFRQFEATLQIAQERLEAEDLTRAVEFALRASDQLAQCAPAAGAGAARAGNAAVARADRQQEAAERKEKATADVTMARAQLLFTKATARKEDPEKLKEPAMLIAGAQQWYERGGWIQVATFAQEAVKVLERLEKEAQDAAKEAQKAKAAKEAAAKKAAAKEAAVAKADPAPAPKVCRGFKARMDKVRVDQAVASGRVVGRQSEARLRRAVAMTTSAQQLADGGNCKEADLLLGEAKTIFKELSAARKDAPAKDDKPSKAATAQKVAPPPPTTCEGFDKEVQSARATERLTAVKVRGEGEEARYRQGSALLRSAEQFSGEGQCEQAEQLMAAALGIFESIQDVPPPPTNPPAAVSQVASDAQAEPDKGVDPAAQAEALEAIGRAKVLQASRADQSQNDVYRVGSKLLGDSQLLFDQGRALEATRLAQQAAFAFESLPGGYGDVPVGEEPWREAYQEVLSALVLRDRAGDVVKGDDERVAYDRGLEFITRSRRAWDDKDYLGSERWAKAAAEEFNAVLTLVSERRKSEGDAEAAAAAEASERDKAAAAEAAAKAKADADAAAAERDKAKAAAEAAAAERDKAKADAAKAKADADKAKADAEAAAKDAQARSAQMKDAMEAVGKAEALQVRCVKEDCKARDAAAWGRAEGLVQDARDALKAENFALADDRASKAKASFEALLAMKAAPAFTVPKDARRIRLDGDKLVVEPKITFVSGRASLTRNSERLMDELARVIKANLGAVTVIELVGYTDTSGNADRNLTLSKQRAETVRAALIARGIPEDLLRAEGRGQANPIASNNTAQGRELNRRVEITLTFKP